MADTPLTNLDTVTSTDRTAAGSQPDFSTPTGTIVTGTTGNVVTSVTASAPLSSTGGATPNIYVANQVTHAVLIGPISGPSAVPTFRAIDSSDIPALPYVSSTTAQTINKVLAGPISGSSSAPTFRLLDAADIPALLYLGTNVDAPLSGAGTSGSHLAISQASTTTNGYVSSADFTTFNNKLSAVTANTPITGSGTSGSPLTIPAASATVSGYLTSTDWNTFNNKQAAFALQDANKLFGGPGAGASAAPTFRSLVVADIPSGLPYASTTSNQSAHAVFIGPTTGNAAPTFRSLVASDIPASLDATTINGIYNTGYLQQTRVGYSTGGNIQIRFDLGAFADIGLTVNASFSPSGSAGITDGKTQDLVLRNTTGGVLTLTWNSSWVIAGPALPTSLAAGAAIRVFLTCNGTAESNVVATYVAAASSGGDVTGPSGAISNRIVTFNGTTGKLIQDSGVTLTAGSGSPALTVNGTTSVSGTNFGIPTAAGTQYARLGRNTASALTASTDLTWYGPDVFNVKDYGAVGNGTTDDSAAIQACFNAACLSNRSVVKFPTTGTAGYKLLTAIELNPGGTVYGGRISVVGDGEYGTMLIAATASMNVFNFKLGAGYSGAEFRNLSFGTATGITAGTAIQTTNDSSSAPQVIFDGIYFENGAGYGYTNGITCVSVGASYFNNIYGVGGVKVVVVTSGVAATSFVNGRQYKITFVGTTDFVPLGAASNTVGEVFTAKDSPGSGTGTADYVKYTYDNSGAGSGAMIKLTGFCINNRFSNIAPLYWYKGISIGDGTGTWQGVEMTNVNTVFTPFGIDLIGNSVPDCGAIQMSNIEVDNGNVPDQSVSYGIRTDKVSDIQMSGFFAIVNAVGTKVGIKFQNRSEAILNNMRIESSSSSNAIELNSMNNVMITDLVQSGFTKSVNLDSGCHYCRISRVITTSSFTPNITDSGTNNICGDSYGATDVLTVSGTPATQTFNVNISQANLPTKANGISVTVASDPSVGAAYDWDDLANTSSNARIKLFKYSGANLSAGPYRITLTVCPNKS